MTGELPWRAPWLLALASFVLAAATGAMMRFAMYQGLPFGLVLGDVRHAHSHLMFFSWATPVLMLVAALALRAKGRKLPGAAGLAVAAAIGGLASYPPFLLSGYGLLSIGGRELPLSMITSGLSGLIWCAFALAYLVGSWRLPRDLPLRLSDGAVLLLMVAWLGAMLLARAGMTGSLTPVTMAAFVDLFLTGFADGWFGIGVLAALALATSDAVPAGDRSAPRPAPRATLLKQYAGAAAWLLAASLTVRSLARLARDAYGVVGPDSLLGVAGALAAAAWLWLVAVLWRQLVSWRPRIGRDRQTLWLARASLALLALKAVSELALATAAGERWVAEQGLFVLLLHAFLLGAVSLGIVAAARALLSPRAFAPAGWLAAAVLVVIVCLLPLTGLWPAAWSGFWTLQAAAYSSLGPPLVGLIALAVLLVARGDARQGGG